MMKKLLSITLLLTLITLFSCSKDDDEENSFLYHTKWQYKNHNGLNTTLFFDSNNKCSYTIETFAIDGSIDTFTIDYKYRIDKNGDIVLKAVYISYVDKICRIDRNVMKVFNYYTGREYLMQLTLV